MPKEKIPSMNDKEWSSKNELGSKTEVIEYFTAEGMKQVKATVKLVSGEEIEAIEKECSEIDMAADDPISTITIDQEKFAMLRTCGIFDIDEETYHDINKNKSSDLRNKMVVIANKFTGANLSEEEIENEKNLESPVTSQEQ